MSVDAVIKKLEALRAQLANGLLGVPAAKELEARMARRIFLQGRNSAGSAIGNYSTKPIYVSLKRREFALLPAIRKLKPRGKPLPKFPKGRTEFADGTPLKTRYFARGYREFREAAGRQPKGKLARLGGKATDGINLNLTGSLAQSFTAGIAAGRVTIGFTSRKEIVKALGAERRFGAIFNPTQEEITAFRVAYSQEVRRFTQNIKIR